MSVKQFFLGLAMVGLVLGSFAQEDSLRAENARLKRQLEEYQKLLQTTSNEVVEVDEEEEELIAKIKKAMDEVDYYTLKINLELFIEKYPDSPLKESYLPHLNDLRKLETENPRFWNSLEGNPNAKDVELWMVEYFYDKFNEKTNESFVTNAVFLEGTFSNSATTNSELSAQFLIKNSSDIAIKLFKYARKNLVKASSAYPVYINIKGSDNTTLEFQNIFSGDRLSLNRRNSQKVHEMLMKGGTTKFRIYEGSRPTSNYNFVVEDEDNGYKKIMGSN